jgi:anion-transporting  ArsA/GET3 family ATPase
MRGLAAKPFTQITDRILGAQFLSDITEFFVLLESMYAGFIERAREVEALLVDPTTGFLVISTLDEAPLHEAAFFVNELEKRNLRVYGWLLNRVLPASLSSPSLLWAINELERASLDDVATDLNVPLTQLSTVTKSLVANARAWSNVALRERQLISTLRSSVPMVAVPSLDGEISDLEGLFALGQRILDEPFVLEFGDDQRSESA